MLTYRTGINAVIYDAHTLFAAGFDTPPRVRASQRSGHRGVNVVANPGAGYLGPVRPQAGAHYGRWGMFLSEQYPEPASTSG